MSKLFIQKCLAIPESKKKKKKKILNFYTGWYKQVPFNKVTLYMYCYSILFKNVFWKIISFAML